MNQDREGSLRASRSKSPRTRGFTAGLRVAEGSEIMLAEEMARFTVPESFTDSSTFAALRGGDLLRVPNAAGVYMVLNSNADPAFVHESCGGHFKGRSPTVPVQVLESKWVDDAQVLYIGKANALRRRLREYASFGAGRPVGHWGGRYIWQLEGCQELRITWMVTPHEDPKVAERSLLTAFAEQHGRIPFANLTV